MNLRWLAALLFGIWLVLVLLGKGGFVHLLLLGAIGTFVVDLAARYRRRLKA